jgi:hypothetical protein
MTNILYQRKTTMALSTNHRITPRIRELFETLRIIRVADGNQLADLLYNGPSSLCREHLRYFTDEGYIGRIEQPCLRSEGSKPYLYYLKKRGAEVLANHKGIFIEELEWEGKKPPISPHLLDGSAFYIRYAIAAKTHGFQIGWKNGLVMRQTMTDEFEYDTPGGYKQKGAIIPDGFGCIITPNGYHWNFMREDDKGTETNAAIIADKIMKYRAYFYTPDKITMPSLYANRYGTELGRVIFSAPTLDRLLNMKSVTEKCGGKNRYWFVVLSDLKTHDPFFDPIYYMAGSEKRVPLLERDKCL